MNSTIDWPKLLSNIIGAIGDSAQWNPIVADMTPGQGVLILGSVLSAGSDGKLKLTDASSYNQAFGILLETIDTGTDAAATQEFAASVARQGSFKATELVMPPGAGPEPVRGCLTQKRHLPGRSRELRTCLGWFSNVNPGKLYSGRECLFPYPP
jgi:hypothetical protein